MTIEERLDAATDLAAQQIANAPLALLPEASAKIKRLRDLLTKYGAHQRGCTWYQSPPQCDCGWHDAFYVDTLT